MTWTALLAACALCYLTKVAGYLAPHHWLERPRVTRTAALVTVALLSSLVAVQTLGSGRALAADARIPALVVAAVLLWRRAPFVVVVLAAAVVAAGLRALS
ncbi:MAG: AzlD domain-containing protein [Kineosporiaceae bacterium]|nr:AzlD domain-containing protein [Kineosporiaceae bacterium]